MGIAFLTQYFDFSQCARLPALSVIFFAFCEFFTGLICCFFRCFFAMFDLDEFIKSPTPDAFSAATRDDLVKVAGHLE